MTRVVVQDGQILVGRPGYDGGWADDPDEYTPAEALALAADLIAGTNECKRQLVAIEMACVEGHAWGERINSHCGGPNVTLRACTRPGCHERNTEPGWMPFAGRYHPNPFGNQPIDCTGPGCYACEEAAIGEALRAHLRAAAAAVARQYEPTILGSAFIEAKFL